MYQLSFRIARQADLALLAKYCVPVVRVPVAFEREGPSTLTTVPGIINVTPTLVSACKCQDRTPQIALLGLASYIY
jgi:hypothetical protein